MRVTTSVMLSAVMLRSVTAGARGAGHQVSHQLIFELQCH